jgi:hypothetical protein
VVDASATGRVDSTSDDVRCKRWREALEGRQLFHACAYEDANVLLSVGQREFFRVTTPANLNTSIVGIIDVASNDSIDIDVMQVVPCMVSLQPLSADGFNTSASYSVILFDYLQEALFGTNLSLFSILRVTTDDLTIHFTGVSHGGAEATVIVLSITLGILTLLSCMFVYVITDKTLGDDVDDDSVVAAADDAEMMSTNDGDTTTSGGAVL